MKRLLYIKLISGSFRHKYLAEGSQQQKRKHVLPNSSVHRHFENGLNKERYFSLPRIDYPSFEKFIDDLASQRHFAKSALEEKLVACGLPDPKKTTVMLLFIGRSI
ncbi:p25-alpha domain containing protein [Asbolus verrucosus]|uniref:p25-alpha domain containing protein n=1 Tax=Asbolus verrucosus TaxID=1661398 RepID=A0A482V1H5_ASBVE|nr:p25-alpha domain containing protein [Asbolus verrucosus]